MSNDRSARNLVAATLLLAALFVAMNRVVVSAPLADWWLPIVLAVIGFAVAAYRPRTRADSSPATTQRRVREYLPASTPLISSPETAVIPQSTEAAAAASPASPQTPVSTVESVPAQEVPASPESPAVQVSTEPLPASPETAEANVMPAHAETDSDVVQPISPGSPEPTPAEPPITGEGVEAVAAAAGPENPTAGQIPVPIEETRNKQEPSHMARTEYAEPERISEKDAPPAPPPDESLEASEKTAPEAQVVMETTADPALPYETDQTGEVTPEATASVSEGRGEETHIAENLTEPASSRVSQQETGETVAGTADDLTRIDGIGPKSAAALRAAGIDSFQKLANTSEARLIEILRAGNVRLVGSTSTWAQQAAYAARGDWEGFNRYIQENKSRGRD